MAGLEQGRRKETALGGVLAAGSVVLLWLACAAPSGRIGLAAAAGLFPMIAAMFTGRGGGYLCWAAASLMGLLILPDKGIALLFLAFLGVYPVGKGRIETVGRLEIEWGLKLAWFNLTLTVFWFVFQELFLPSPPEWLANHTLLLYGLGSLVFVIYDIGLSRLITLLRVRLSRARGH